MPLDGSPLKNPQLTDVQKVLLGAAQVIRERGWCQKALVDGGGRLCVMGAILAVDTGDPEGDWGDVSNAAMDRLYGYLDKQPPMIWNNAPERTAEEVIHALEAAAFSEVQS